MNSSLHTKEVTTAKVRSVAFGFYSDEEIRKLSVKKIVSPIIFDNSKAPVEGGLYDPALGPLDYRERCTTCGLTTDCPGHFGHIELAVPVYNPLVFTTLYKLLRCSCLHCFKVRMADAEVQRYITRLTLLLQGRLTEAQGIQTSTSAGAKRAAGDDKGEDAGTSGSDGETSGAGSPTSVLKGPAPTRRVTAAMTGQSLEAAIDTVSELFKRQPTQKCANCGAFNPTIKKEGYSKLFLMPLQAKRAAANKMRGTEVLPTLQRLQRGLAAPPGPAPAGVAQTMLEDVKVDEDIKPAHNEDKPEKMEIDGEEGVFVADVPAAELPRQPKNVPSSMATREEDSAAAMSQPKFLTPAEVMEIMRCMWEANAELLGLIYPADVGRRQLRSTGSRDQAVAAGKAAAARNSGYREFFLESVAVTPNRFRPVSHVGEMVYEHAQNTTLVKVLNMNLELQRLANEAATGADSGAPDGRLLRAWLDMQNAVNAFIDSTTAENEPGAVGIRQQLEKKEGLFRKNMMGKRVNFAARSVISPDVYLNGGEIGVPPYIAARLTFPERVTPWNVERLCEAVMAGPGRNPGAVAVEDERGRLLMLRDDPASREAVARRLYSQLHASGRASARSAGGAAEAGTADGSVLGAAATTPASASKWRTGAVDPAALAHPGLAEFGGCKVVYRSMEDGDLLLTNRQPTLHKPGMMAHRARIMRDERTIRFHYANCSTFNADFDGDEINLHLPQDQMGRAEGYNIVHADRQFFVPTDGKPLRGLIQDHIVSGTLLTMRDRFFSRRDYCSLVYEAVVGDCAGSWEVWLAPPALLKPEPLWTGKQVLTAVLMHYTRDALPFSLSTSTKVPVETYGRGSGEGKLLIRHNHLLTGCVDKNCFGKHGLLHLFHELYGAERTSLLTASLSRLFTGFLQRFGFTCGMSDVRLVDAAERERAELLTTADVRCLEAAAGLLGPPRAEPLVAAGLPVEAAFVAAELGVREQLRERFRSNPDTGALLDMKSSGAMHPLSSDVVRACLPGGQAKPFRHNMMALMTVTGAKGSVVNFSQISCLLGQQELEGRRVPRMASGKTLPCFAPYDVGARSGGFVADRFLTGLRPQEYYFHCMAGREGLVDTTVKTSRSGYIQRCMVKNLEPLRVGYDGTVRDDTDASVVQFAYGEDGTDTTQTGCLRTLPFFYYNMPQLGRALGAPAALGHAVSRGAAERQAAADRDVRAWSRALLEGPGSDAAPAPPAADEASSSKKKKKKKDKKKDGKHAGDDDATVAQSSSSKATVLPIDATESHNVLGVTSEGFQAALVGAVFGGGLRPPAPAEEMDRLYGASSDKLVEARSTGSKWSYTPLDAMDFVRLMQLRFQACQAAPGEAVGVLAAQSIGEPSTQMTLNTFHMAGRGEANVTLGIPRLREILMTASASIATPVMTMPVVGGAGASGAATLVGRMRRILLAEALAGLDVEENMLARSSVMDGARARVVTVTLHFHPETAYPPELNVTFDELAACFKAQFVTKFHAAVRSEARRASTGEGGAVAAVSLSALAGEEGALPSRAGAAGGTDAAGDEARLDAEQGTGAGRATRHADDASESEDEEGKTQFGQGRGEHATYDAGDEDDALIAAAARAMADRREGVADEDDEEEQAPPANDAPADTNNQQEKTSEPAAASKKQGKKPEQHDAELAGGVIVDRGTRSCAVKLHLALTAPKLLIREVAERVAAAVVLRGTPGITKCYVIDAQRGAPASVQTDGINLLAAFGTADIVDVDALYCNSPAAMLETYGVEAARATIMREASAVFGAYGIGVDPRHLSLIADYMTHLGGYRPCNRIGISASTSPFLKVTFETAASFLVSSTLHGDVDTLTSPASRIVLGAPVAMGTGSLDLVQRLDFA